MQNKSPLQVKSVPSVCSRLPSPLGNSAQDLSLIFLALDLNTSLCVTQNPLHPLPPNLGPALLITVWPFFCVMPHFIALFHSFQKNLSACNSLIPHAASSSIAHRDLSCSSPSSSSNLQLMPSCFPSPKLLHNIFWPQFLCQHNGHRILILDDFVQNWFLWRILWPYRCLTHERKMKEINELDFLWLRGV